ncbi:MAG: class I SAM-dependent methyltransferase [Myxococcota bacterium]
MSQGAEGPNAEQFTYWNEEAGAKWVELQERLDTGIGPLGLEAIARAAPRAGERVLDVGCGCGQTTLQLSERVGEGGSVLGVDLSMPMLERARERAAQTGVAQVRFEQGDAQIFPFEPGSFDLVFSRFGVMFFAEPPEAFAALLRATRSGGRIAFLCWRGAELNPFMSVPYLAVAKHVELPPPPPPGTPGPLSFADEDRVRDILGSAGWSQVTFETWQREFLVGGRGNLDDAVDFSLRVGPVTRALRMAEGELDMEAITRSVREAIAPYVTDEGVRMPCAPALVTARKP